MFFCEICNEQADIHHIVHRHEGGLDIEINYMYLCPKHHRGKYGPHKCLETDIKYKIRLQNKLYNLLKKEFYTAKKLSSTLNISSNMTKRIIKNLSIYKEGYKKDDIILTLMGGKFYSQELLDNIKMQKLLDNIY